MNRDQARVFIEKTFKQGFDKNRYHKFISELLHEIDESKASHWNNQYIKSAFKDHVERCERIGTYTAPGGEKLDVLIVHLTKASKLERARTAMRNYVADLLKMRDEKDAALAAFVSPSEKQWRFSYVKMEYATVERDSGKVDVETRLTPARRFSYIVGEGESCHTAQTRFVGLLQDTRTKPTLQAIEETFSVEAVTKEFFKRYYDLFEEIRQYLEKLRVKDKTIGKEFESKKIEPSEFAKKLMGQIVFLYFLQKKGWLGVEKGRDWGSGPHDFMRRLLKGEYGKYENFFNDVLEPLFYDTLATDRGHEAWCKRFKCRIPFLNGGLFEPIGGYDWQKTDIIIPNDIFTNSKRFDEGLSGTGIFDIFDRYNFTVNEAEPLEKEVAIDPEMLGKVFENLIEENRRKGLGAYYTPREIVHYMCQQSLINYLDTALNKEKEVVPKGDIETFIQQGEQISHYESVTTRYAIRMPERIKQNAREIDEKLSEITVCDPAVGSGAFLVGMMTEIVRARLSLIPHFSVAYDPTPYFFKRHAIQNCLYGVDIDPGAVEIAKLRLWLSLVVDEEDVKMIKPLPNLDYKIVVGNSLLGLERGMKGDQTFDDELFRQLEDLKKLEFNETNHNKREEYKIKISELIEELTHGQELFDFGVYFSEVFRSRNGFDAVIANPPYVQIKGIPQNERRIYEQQYNFASGRFNLFYLFIEKCKTLLIKKGIASFIVPDRLLLNTQCKEIRKWLLNDNDIKELVSFDDHVFETAVVDSIILLFQNYACSSKYIFARRKVKHADIYKTKQTMIPITYFELSPSSQLDINYDQRKLNILEKIKYNSNSLGEISETKDGIIQSTVGEQLFLCKKLDKYSKPLLFGRNIERYLISYENNYVNYKPKQMMELEMQKIKKGTGPGLRMRNPEIFERKKILTRQTADEIIAAYDENHFYYANTLHGTTITDQSYNPYYILGIMNSVLTTWYYRTNTDEEGKVFAQIKIELLRKIPIPKVSKEKQKPIVDLAKKIMSCKKRSNSDTLVLQKEIDHLVYELYGLTAEEIKLVEESVRK